LRHKKEGKSVGGIRKEANAGIIAAIDTPGEIVVKN
jgi:hypothetical protein